MHRSDSQLELTDEDDAVLRAVHAFLLCEDASPAINSDEDVSILGQCCGDDAPSANSGSSGSVTRPAPEPVQAASPSPPAPPPLINRSRLRMRNEIVSLREKAIALEKRLGELRRNGDAAAAAATTVIPTSASHTLALTQRKRVKVAEKERAKLRETIANYKVSMKRVRRIVRNQILQHPQLVSLIQPGITRRATLDLDDAAEFQGMAEYLEAMYAQLDSLVFQSPRLEPDCGTEQLQDLRILNDDAPNMSLQFAESRLLPFDVVTTGRAVWLFHTTKASEIVVHMEEDVMDSENVIRRSFVSTLAFPNCTARARGRVEVRRYFDKDRVVILHCAMFHRMEQSGGDGTDGYGVRVLNWTVISPPRSERLRNMDRPLSHVDVFEMVVPFFPVDATVSPQDREELKAFCVETMKFVHAFERQAVENILLDSTKK